MTAVGQFGLHLLIVTLRDGVEVEGDNADDEEEGREETGHEANARDRGS